MKETARKEGREEEQKEGMKDTGRRKEGKTRKELKKH